jgi:hypothetical protein
MRGSIILGWVGVAMAMPARSAVTATGDAGFATENSVEVAADSARVYALLAVGIGGCVAPLFQLSC